MTAKTNISENNKRHRHRQNGRNGKTAKWKAT